MAKVLELLFTNQEGKTAKISIDNPKEPVDLVQVKAAMTAIISANVFMTNGGGFVSSKGARLVDRNVSEYEII